MSFVYANIIVDISASELDRVFQYRVPTHLEDVVQVGTQVKVPFGQGNRMIKGFVVELTKETDIDASRIKEISEVIEQDLAVESQLVKLAYFIKQSYGSTMISALKTVLPIKRSIQAVSHKVYHLNVSKMEVETLLEQYATNKKWVARRQFLQLFLEHTVVDTSLIKKFKISASAVNTLIRDNIIEESRQIDYRNPVRTLNQSPRMIDLNVEQQQVISDICSYPEDIHLLHGITGSGKTEVYIQLIDQTLASGKQAIVLIPEISLTFQTVSRFYDHFGDKISIMNSKLSAGEKYDQYLRVKNGEVSVIIGPRSALFMPFDHLGLIIIDEEHDGAYKSDKMPKYHARDVAIYRAQLAKASVVLGSATPSVETYKKALDGSYHLHRLTKRAVIGSHLPRIKIIDLKEEFRLNNKKIFSKELEDLIRDKLERKEQVILFLNRRGYAGFVSCRSCGHVLKCKHCEISMTSHYNSSLKCHYCGYEESYPKVCPTCGSPYVAAFGVGTQKVETMVKELFKEARVLRLDKDSTSKKGQMENILASFKRGEADILIGTQMIVKGHDFSRVTLVGVLAADLSMFSNDYMASERTFQLLTQVAGRAGRGELKGDVVIQTYNPDHYSIVHASKQDYEGFYQEEIRYRSLMKYPPMVQVMVILLESKNEIKAQKVIEGVHKLITHLIQKKNIEDFYMIGPTDAYIAKGKDNYRKVLYLKHIDYKVLILVKDYIERCKEVMDEFVDINIQFDFNPMNVY